MRRILTALFAALMLTSVGCRHEHTFIDATCTEPMTCTECDYTEGEPLGHSFADATCTEPMTCSVCGITEGEPLGHVEGDWTITKQALPLEKGRRELRCTVCDEVIKTESYEYDMSVMGEYRSCYVENGEFTYTAGEFSERMKMIGYVLEMNGADLEITTTTDPVFMICVGPGNEGSHYCIITFVNGENPITDPDSHFTSMLIGVSDHQHERFDALICALMFACDDANSDYHTIFQKIIDKTAVEINEIWYTIVFVANDTLYMNIYAS